MRFRFGARALARLPGVIGSTSHHFAAASLTESLREIASAYSRTAPDGIVFSFGGSSTLARQIEEGAPADIFFSADTPKWIGFNPKGLIESSTERTCSAIPW